LGLFAAGIAGWLRRKEIPEVGGRTSGLSIVLLCVSVGGLALALLLTVTRAPQLAFMISSGLIVFLALGRRWFLTAMLVLVPIAVGGLIFLQQSRRVDFFDRSDESTRYRQMMVRDGLRLWADNPRHFVLGVGMDSIQKHWQEWDLFDGGWQPMGHFHSTPVQMLVERGLAALLIWLAILAIYARHLLKGLDAAAKWYSKGILLGCLGGLAGFVASSLVHYNLGDQEVAMVFFMLMGLGLRSAAGPEESDLEARR
jgi:O-antigen ligase